jgi:hypothetical protein
MEVNDFKLWMRTRISLGDKLLFSEPYHDAHWHTHACARAYTYYDLSVQPYVSMRSQQTKKFFISNQLLDDPTSGR